MRTLQEWMQYMEERKRGAQDTDPSERGLEQRTADAEAPQQPAAPARRPHARANPPARRVVAPAPTETAPPSIMPGVPGPPGGIGGNLARGVEQARAQMRRALQAQQAGQRELPLDVPAATPTRISRRSAEESRDDLIERLLDPELTLQETAKLLNVCPTTVRRYTNRGVLNHYRTPGNQRRFRLSDVLDFMRRQQG